MQGSTSRNHCTVPRCRWNLLLYLALPCYLSSAATVKDFGAAGNGIVDDTRAIQAAIDASSPGDTVTFPPGIYLTSEPLLLRSDRTYRGQGLSILGPGVAAIIALTEEDNAHDISIQSIIFQGGGVRFPGSSSAAHNISIIGCTFQNITNTLPGADNHIAIYVPVAITNARIAGNRFVNILFGGQTSVQAQDGAAVVVYDPDHTEITDNTFDTVNEGVYLCFGSVDYYCSSAPPAPEYDNVVVSRNAFLRVHRMAVEAQGSGATNMAVENNIMSQYLDPYCESFGLSIVNGGRNTMIRSNTLLADTPLGARALCDGPNRYGYAIEVDGDHAIISGNMIAGLWSSGVALGAATNVTVAGNRLCGPPGAQTIGWEGQPSDGASIQDNILSEVCCMPSQIQTVGTRRASTDSGGALGARMLHKAWRGPGACRIKP